MSQYAVLVGVSHFKSATMNSLCYIEDDVNEMYQVLINNFGYTDDEIVKLIDAQATIEEIRAAIQDICGKACEGDRVIVYFATHGKTIYDSPFLATYDAENTDPKSTIGWIFTTQMLTPLYDAKCNILAFIDSCQSTVYLTTRGVSDSLDKANHKIINDQYEVIFTAAGPNEQAHSDCDNHHGCWTYYLLKALSGEDPSAQKENTNKITLNSLQNYLCLKVKERVENLYKDIQTPHICGTYSNDVTIIDQSGRGAGRVKVKDIFFGDVDADSERKQAPNELYITKNFYDLNSICAKLQENNNIQIIIGNKGTGKTYLGEYLEKNYSGYFYQSLGRVTPNMLSNLTFAQSDERGKYVDAWLYGIYTILAFLIVSRQSNGWQKFYSLIKEIYGDNTDLYVSHLSTSVSRFFNKKIKNGVCLSPLYKEYTDSKGVASLENIIFIYQDLLTSEYPNGIYFFLDGFDEQLRSSMDDKNKAIFLDLLEANNISRDALPLVKIILMFRDDILMSISGEANLNKIKSGKTAILSWKSISKQYQSTPLYQLIEKRISTSEEERGVRNRSSLNDLIPIKKINHTNTWEWILDLTTHTPRDIVSFFNCCKKYAGEQTHITEDNIWDATRDYSEYLWNEFSDVLAGTILSDHTDDLATLFNKVGLSHNIRQNNTVFSFAEFQNEYTKCGSLNSINIMDSLKILYETGIMCVHTSTGVTYWYFRENPIPFDKEIWVTATFDIHKGLWKKFHIW